MRDSGKGSQIRKSVSLVCSRQVNPADHILDLIQTDHESETLETREAFLDRQRIISDNEASIACLAMAADEHLGGPANILELIMVLAERTAVDYSR